jgi:hypothetical protein
MGRQLWHPDRYLDFLVARRELLAKAANDFLIELRDGATQAVEPLRRIGVLGEEEADDRAQQVQSLVAELSEMGCAQPQIDSEIADPHDGRVLAVAEAFWPDGLQAGMGGPVVLELDLGSELSRMGELGYQVFTSIEAMRRFVLQRNAENAGSREPELV